jgi:hypothetical protein
MLMGAARFGMKDKDLGLKILPCRDRLALFTPEKSDCKRNLLPYILGMAPMFYLIPLKGPLACQVHGSKMVWGEYIDTVCYTEMQENVKS